MKPKTEPLLFRPRVFYSLAGAGIVSAIIGLAAKDTTVGWWIGFPLACICVFGTIVAWAIPVRIEGGRVCAHCSAEGLHGPCPPSHFEAGRA